MPSSLDRSAEAPTADTSTATPATTIIWFRRDLRLADNPALVAAFQECEGRHGGLLPVSVWEPRERRRWAPGAAARWWLYHSLAALDGDLRRRGSRLMLTRGDPIENLPCLARAVGAGAVVWAAGTDPEEAADDDALRLALASAGIAAVVVPSAALLYDPARVRTREGRPHSVFTPFWRVCLSQGAPETPLPPPSQLPATLRQSPPTSSAAPNMTSLAELADEAVRPWSRGFGEVWQPGEAGAQARLALFLEEVLPGYAATRDRPDLDGTSRLSPHLHWGEITPRQVWHAVAGTLAEAGLPLEAALGPVNRGVARQVDLGRSAGAFVRQLGWREFAHHLLRHFPQLPTQPLDPRFAAFPWRDDPAGLQAWRDGRTGYPLVDAGMRQLWATGWTHNRARLVAASFLVKDLLLPWQTGEDWFWDTLVDADLADNALGWQWVAGCGPDAAPYFRIFNPETQRRRYDPEDAYVRRWAAAPGAGPASSSIPPIVEHGEARRRALAAYDAVRGAFP